MSKDEWIAEAKERILRFVNLNDDFFEELYERFPDKTPMDALRINYEEND